MREAELPEVLAAFPEYRSYACCAVKPGYSGVLTLVHKRLELEPKQVQCSPQHMAPPVRGLFEDEGRYLLLAFETFFLLNLYIPSGTSGESRQALKMKFLETLSSNFKNNSGIRAQHLVVCGDFNICHRAIDIHHPREAERRKLTGFLPEERAWMDTFCELGMVDAFRQCNGDLPGQYTWWTFRAGARGKDLGWRIDYFFVSHDLCKALSEAHIHKTIAGSDHCPISVVLTLP